MMGMTNTGDTALLKFDSPSSPNGMLVILRNRIHEHRVTVPFSYRLCPVKASVDGDPRVQITFPEKQSLVITCDPLSDNCRSDTFITESGVTFALVVRSTAAKRAQFSDNMPGARRRRPSLIQTKIPPCNFCELTLAYNQVASRNLSFPHRNGAMTSITRRST